MWDETPDFVREPGGADAVAEFSRFAAVVGGPAAHLLAEFAELHNHGVRTDIPAADEKATKVRGLCCRIIEKWAIFYSVIEPCRITVVHVGHMNPHPFASLESEAETRLRHLEPLR
jgi:hypothetical protein